MSYSPKHKRDTREKILESARRLFNRNGYSGVSIEQIMSDAGLTHGGFYRHFSGKDELTRQPSGSFFARRHPQLGKSAGLVRSRSPMRKEDAGPRRPGRRTPADAVDGRREGVRIRGARGQG